MASRAVPCAVVSVDLLGANARDLKRQINKGRTAPEKADHRSQKRIGAGDDSKNEG